MVKKNKKNRQYVFFVVEGEKNVFTTRQMEMFVNIPILSMCCSSLFQAGFLLFLH